MSEHYTMVLSETETFDKVTFYCSAVISFRPVMWGAHLSISTCAYAPQLSSFTGPCSWVVWTGAREHGP